MLGISTLKRILLFTVVYSVALTAQSNIKLELSQKKENTNTTLMTVSMTNDSNESMKVLKWNTPFEKTLSANIFHITNGKNTAQYIGRVVKRLNPKPEDYMTLAVNETKTITIDLSKYYTLEEAKYIISYKGTVKAKDSATQSVSDILSKTSIPSIELFLIPSSLQKKTTSNSEINTKLTPNFNGCTQSRIDTLNLAHDAAIVIAQQASTVMDTAVANTSGDRYRVWFGTADSGRQSTVTTHFSNIYSALDTQNIAFDCTCTDSFFAYVYSNQPYTIYLCNAFWSANLNGTDSQAGTLVHEMAHFTVIAGTDDYAYGHTDAKNLAITNPNNAVFNSDNYEYFSENTPSLSMDNSFESATIISNIIENLPLTGNISVAGEKDIYKFTVQNTGIYTFNTTGSLDSFGTLYNATYGNVKSDDDSGSGLNFSFSMILQQGQTYYLEVSAYSTGTGAYSLHSSFDIDSDNDGIGNKTDPDDDNDGVLDVNDAFPFNASESVDTDNDGIGNNADKDDDNDGISDSDEVANGLNPLNSADGNADFDTDGFSNALEISVGTNIRSASNKPIWTPILVGDGTLIIVPTVP